MKSTFLSSHKSDLLLVILAAIIWFSLLGFRDLMDPDAGRYAEVAREMLSTGDWVTPRINGYKFFDKPPMQYWGSALSMSLLGETNAAARLWCTLLGFIGALWMWLVGKRLYGDTAGRYTFLILLSAFLYVAIGHVNVLDMGVSVFLAITVGAFALAQASRDTEGKGQGWMLLCWAAAAASVLSKGLIGIVFPAASIFLYSLWQKDWALWRNLHILKGLALFLLLVMPWFILVSQANEQFLHYFFIHEHFERFTSNVHKRNHPWWYFITILCVGFLPWIINIIHTIIKPGFSWSGTPAGNFDATRFFWVYCVFIFLFFSYSHSKLVPYILPIFPFLALLTAAKLANAKQIISPIVITGLLAVGVAIVAWKIVDFAKPRTPVAIFLDYRPWLIAASVSLAIASLIAFYYRTKPTLVITTIAIGSLLAFKMGLLGFQSHSPIRSAKQMATAIQSYNIHKALKIYAINRIDYSLLYYLQRKITLVGYKGDMKFGINREPENWIPDEAAFLPLWLTAKDALAILSKQTYQSWLEKQIPMQIIYQDPRRLVVSRAAS